MGKIVNCRIGSLEKAQMLRSQIPEVNCRIGSLESPRLFVTAQAVVNCRIGSLEIYYDRF